ncbi:G patch domain-containing 1-like protein [Cladobotryum mycophilum]|uniref:G patch domain-containing 1-like protein n=1 Tax=Cladobotryum mycophilum TaxID=491253 RepID=A0ABR0S7I2_9HYPO
MSYKRSRSTFEADLHAPYAIFGTPLPDEGERDDGSYLPLWKQDVRDEKGRRRLHGAFTGGWSAGYFNTVGSKEGWTPSTFVSSRTNRRKDESGNKQQRAEDYMDEEDLADAAEAQTLQTSQAFAGLGSSTHDEIQAGGLMGLFRSKGDTMGLKLLRKMGWKDGQGIGPKIRRSARLDVGTGPASTGAETYLFAPENAGMIQFIRKTDRKGFGHYGETKLSLLGRGNRDDDDNEEDEPRSNQGEMISLFSSGKTKTKSKQGSIGVGVLNDTGSDEEDPYEIGPKIKYNRVIGGDKKKKAKKASAVVNPLLKNAPVFTLKTARGGNGLRRCQDGRLPLDGFVLARATEDLTSILSKYAPPPVPPDWKSSKHSGDQAVKAEYISTADAAKASNLDPRSRAAVLGEKALPGKSVFDYISASSREKLVVASGKKDLPLGRGEVPDEFKVSDGEHKKSLWDQVPKLDRDTAIAAIARGSRGPYADDETKRSRYRRYLEHNTGSGQPLPEKPKGMPDDDFLREMNEFHNCARIFKPMTGFMASRFTTAKSSSTAPGRPAPESDLITKAELKPADPAEEAAKMGMFGNLTRSVEDFFPTRLLCKRFNVKAPSHSQPDDEPEGGSRVPSAGTQVALGQIEDVQFSSQPDTGVAVESDLGRPTQVQKEAFQENQVNPDRNEAVEGTAANADVLRAIFGDSDSDNDSE